MEIEKALDRLRARLDGWASVAEHTRPGDVRAIATVIAAAEWFASHDPGAPVPEEHQWVGTRIAPPAGDMPIGQVIREAGEILRGLRGFPPDGEGTAS
jgi:hypothetical protein